MKNHFRKLNLIGLSLLWTFLMISLINVTNGETKIPTAPWESEHIIRLHSLFLWNGASDTNPLFMKINTGDKFLSVQWWLAIWSSHTVGQAADSSVIGWWKNNKILDWSKNSWIVWWESNTIKGKSSLIGWWKYNEINGDNAIIWWWNHNHVNAINGVVIWWENNTVSGQNSIILWWENNTANWKNSLVFWQYSEWGTWSFVFGIGKIGTTIQGKENSARIDASSGVLIWTLEPINGVRLVIGWAVNLTWQSNTNWWTGWEIRVVNGCIFAYDGSNWQVMWKSSRESCGGEVQTCQFWETLLYQWDQADAYTNFWSLETGCPDKKVHVTCSGWNLVDENNLTGPYYPYCYKIGG